MHYQKKLQITMSVELNTDRTKIYKEVHAYSTKCFQNSYELPQ